MWPVTRVLVVDDDGRFRGWARVLLERAGFVVVGEAADGGAAIEAAGRLRPELVVLDVGLPDMDGFEVARRLCARRSPPAVVLISSRERGDFGERFDSSPAVGFVPKEQLSGEVLVGLLARARGAVSG
jgi:CheY-like chemotaxis protein